MTRRVFRLILILCLAVFAPDLKAQSPTPNPAVEQLSNALFAAESGAQREKLLAENKSLPTAELAAALLQKGRQFMSENEFPNAERAFGLSLEVSAAANKQAGIAAALRNPGGVSGIQGKFDKALEYLQTPAAEILIR